MKMTFYFPLYLKYISFILIGIGVAAFGYAFYTNPGQAWVNLLLNNFYFLSIAVGALFFIAIQYVSESGWSAMFKRVPEAMSGFILVAGIFALLLLIGSHSLYHWTHADVVETDALIAHKSPYLNLPFFIIRLVIVFASWILLYLAIRNLSQKENEDGSMALFEKNKFYSKLFIFTFVITFSIAAFDWIMSIDSHWFSTVFALRAIISAIYFSIAFMVLLLLFLNKQGYFENLSKYHLHDFGRYIFRFSIVWGYLWFIQYLILWYANIPEGTQYYVPRLQGDWEPLFYVDFILNWTIPFVVMMSDSLGRNRIVLIVISSIMLIGFYVSLYLQIWPGTLGVAKFGLIEAGCFLGFLGLFLLVFFYLLSKRPLLSMKHPYMEESLNHHF
jgi:hypothetical protein